MIKMVKGVKGIDPERSEKGIEEVESKMDLLPSSGTSDTIHVMNLISKLERADLERYTDKEWIH
jgi:hypothetical protein